jgi:hypothetical protein
MTVPPQPVRGRPYPRLAELRPHVDRLGDKAAALAIGTSRNCLQRILAGLPTYNGTHAMCDRFLDRVEASR